MAFLVAALCLALGLAACGKRASDVEPDDTMRKDGYPRTYPDTANDPPGTYIPGRNE